MAVIATNILCISISSSLSLEFVHRLLALVLHDRDYCVTLPKVYKVQWLFYFSRARIHFLHLFFNIGLQADIPRIEEFKGINRKIFMGGELSTEFPLPNGIRRGI